jgi:hypothetical protein
MMIIALSIIFLRINDGTIVRRRERKVLPIMFTYWELRRARAHKAYYLDAGIWDQLKRH